MIDAHGKKMEFDLSLKPYAIIIVGLMGLGFISFVAVIVWLVLLAFA